MLGKLAKNMKSNKNTYSKFKAYLQNKLSDKDRYAFEKNEQKNSFEQEALDGAKNISPENFIRDTETLQKIISNKKEKRSVLMVLRKYNTAASVLIIVGMASYFYWTNRPDLPKDTIFEPPVLQELSIPQEEPLELKKEIIIMEETTISPMQQSKQMELIPEEVVLEETVPEEVVKRKKIKNTQRKLEPLAPRTQDAIVSIENEEELEMQDTEIIPEQIHGTVLGEDGKPLPGVAVMIQDSNNGSVTDFDGNFKIEGDSTATLVFDYLGFEQAIKPATDSMLVVMQEDQESLDEVVVIGYGTQKKKDITGAVTTITPKNLKGENENNIEKALNVIVAGVSIEKSSLAKTGAIAPQGDLDAFKEWVANEFDSNLLDDQTISIYLEFKILKTGEISKIRFKNKVKKKIKREIKRILETSELWTPAKENGVLKEETILIKLEF